MPALRVVDLAEPFLPLIPEIPLPYHKIDQIERIIYTVSAAAIFIVLGEIPLYGALGKPLEAPDPISWLRSSLASARGSPLELGVIPILLSGYLMQILAGTRKIKVSLDLRADRRLFQSTQKSLAILITVLLSAMLVFSGVYGEISVIGIKSGIFLFLQLFLGSFALIITDEILQKGYGLGTGVLLFTMLKSAQTFFWAAFSPASAPTSRGPQYYGAIPNFGYQLFNRSPSFALVDATLRPNLPNLFDIFSAMAVFAIVVYYISARYDISVRSTKARSTSQNFPIRLFYTAHMPVLFWAAIVGTVQFICFSLYTAMPTNALLLFTGRYTVKDALYPPVSGLAYYLYPPLTFWDALRDPIRSLTYALFTVVIFMVFGHLWQESSGATAVDIAKQLKDNNVVIAGLRDVSAVKELKRLVPLAATLGAFVLGLIVAVADIFTVPGWGPTISLGVQSILTYLEILGAENIDPGRIAGLGVQ